MQASEGKKVMKRVLFYLIQNGAPDVSGSLCPVGWVSAGWGGEGGRAGLQSCCFGARRKSQATYVGLDIQYSCGRVLAGVSSLHTAVVSTVL